MSEENVEIVRWIYEEGFARRSVDVPGLAERIAPGYRFHARPSWPGQAVYRLDEMTALWADLDATYTDHTLVPTKYEDLGSHVLVTLRQAARLRDSEQVISQTFLHLWHLSEGKIQQTLSFTDRTDALEAAGVSE